VAVIFDDAKRPDTTGTHCLRALKKRTVTVHHFQPSQLEGVSPGDFDLYLWVDDGLRYEIPRRLCPRAWWAIDTHLDFAWYRERAPEFDLVFTAQRDGAARLEREGIHATWLPLACDPAVHCKLDVPKQFDMSFVGNALPGKRTELLALIRQHYGNTFIGRRYGLEMAETYSASRIVFNRSVGNDVNMRVFETLACGSLLLTNDLADNGQDELFLDGVHLATYRDPEELLDKIAYYLKREEVRERIASAGCEEVLAKHTYEHRMEQLLRAVTGCIPTGNVQATASAVCDRRPKDAEVEAGASPQPGHGLTSTGGVTGGGLRCTERSGESATASGHPALLQKDGSYFQFPRPELLAMIPTSARRVLDVGCGVGKLGESLKSRQQAEVVGIERDKAAAAAARASLDRVIVEDVETLTETTFGAEFDCIVCGDVLEHLQAPGRFLDKARRWLAPDGRLVASIPNARHHSVISSLLDGNWTYEPAGLLDETHLHFFTRRDIEALFQSCGYLIQRVQVVSGPGYEQWERQGRPGSVKLGSLSIAGLPAEEAEEFFVYQYLIDATPLPVAAGDSTSIIVLTYNELEYTRQCVESVLERTAEPYELIFVDNGSTDGTVDYLLSLLNVTLIENSENRGFPAAVNQGMRASRGKFVVLLNNDVVVTSGWMARLLAAANRDDRIGLVGPCLTWPECPQSIEVPYHDLTELEPFARQWATENQGRVEDVPELVGACLLIRRELIDAIGLFDEEFGIGQCEDKDYCRRTAAAG